MTAAVSISTAPPCLLFAPESDGLYLVHGDGKAHDDSERRNYHVRYAKLHERFRYGNFPELAPDYTANICAASEKFFTPATVPCRFAQLSRLKLTVRRISPNTPAAVTPAPAP